MWVYNQTSPNELIHFGKKGMKWGRRNTKPSLTSIVRNKKIARQTNPDYMKLRSRSIKQKIGVGAGFIAGSNVLALGVSQVPNLVTKRGVAATTLIVGGVLGATSIMAIQERKKMQVAT